MYDIKNERKIIQIIPRRIDEGSPDQLIALCNDGTVWKTSHRAISDVTGWVEVPRIPQS